MSMVAMLHDTRRNFIRRYGVPPEFLTVPFEHVDALQAETTAMMVCVPRGEPIMPLREQLARGMFTFGGCDVLTGRYFGAGRYEK